jgi:DNA-binding NarL/FixJ family response regulator
LGREFRALIRVLLADDAEIIRSQIRRHLATEADISIVGEATDYEQTIQMLKDFKPDILLTDLRMRVGANAQPADFGTVCQKLGCVVVAMTFAEIDSGIRDFAAEMHALRLIDKTRLFHTLIPTLREVRALRA